MKGEGRLDITIALTGAEPLVTIASSRPLELTRALVGLSAEQAIATVPLLFAICGMAQATATAEAVSVASGMMVNRSKRTAREMLVLAEAAREHLIAMVRGLAILAAAPAEQDALLPILRNYQRLRSTIDPNGTAFDLHAASNLDAAAVSSSISAFEEVIESQVLGEPCDTFLARVSTEDFHAWAKPCATSAQRFAAGVSETGRADDGDAVMRPVPRDCAAELAPRMLERQARTFLAAPLWAGAPCETTALARQAARPLVQALRAAHGNGVFTRLAARLVELATLPGVMRSVLRQEADVASPWYISAHQFEAHAGVSEVETARGRLIHCVRLVGDRIAHHAILAPTEWNFHPRGIASAALASIDPSKGDIEARARAVLSMFDPCVAFDVRVA